MGDVKDWYVYILQCKNGALYTGVTNDLDSRMKAHRDGVGSKYVRRYGFSHLVAWKKCRDKSDACKCEYWIKKLPRSKKVKWFCEN